MLFNNFTSFASSIKGDYCIVFISHWNYMGKD